MASEAQANANRANAQRSTGPRTAEGKVVSRLNALKHGILADQVVLPNENAEEFAALERGVHAELQPVEELEELQADLIAAYAWRLRRVMRVEKGIFVHESYGQMAQEARKEASSHVSHPNSMNASLVAYVAANDGEAAIDDPEAHQAALARAREADVLQASGDGALGRAFIAQTDTLAKLSRYEAHIQRSMVKTLDVLRQLQASRRETGHPTSESPLARRELDSTPDESDP